ncbi:hypothetical protein ACQBAU_01695 [Propionibacteriaceae bacterium Y2011]
MINRWQRRQLLRSAGGLAVASTLAAWAPTSHAEPTTNVTPARSGCDAMPGLTLTDLGHAIGVTTIMRAAFGHGPTGSPAMYVVPAGENAALNIIDIATGQRLAAHPLPGARGSWAITTAPDGHVYVGTYSQAHLYRYSPTSDTVTDLGAPVPGEAQVYGLSTGPDGSVYGGTYPNCHVFSWDPATNSVTDFGRVDPTSKYVRGAVYDADHNAVIAGIYSPVAKLVRVDVATGQFADITPPGLACVGVGEVGYAGGTVFASVGKTLHAVDPITGAARQFIDGVTGSTVETLPVNSRFISPEYDGAVFYTSVDRELRRIELATLTSTVATAADEPIRLPATGLGFGISGEPSRPVLHGKVGTSSGLSFSYDLTEQAFTSWTGDVLPDYSPVIDILPGRAGTRHEQKIYVSGYLSGATAVLDIASDTYDQQQPKLGQVEDWCWFGDDIVAGIYPTATLKRWTPGAGNPASLFSLQDSHEQNRPLAVITDDTRLYVGTRPDYGKHGGALTIHSWATGSRVVHRDIVPDQTVATLTLHEGLVYGGSAIEGGGGTQPIATEAKLFSYDPATDSTIGTWSVIAGAESINHLSTAPDGGLWGIADGTVFAFDTASHTVSTTIPLYPGRSAAHGGEFVWHPNGLLYVTSSFRLYSVDVITGTGLLLQTGVGRVRLAADGSLYVTHQPPGGLARTNVARLDPSPTALSEHRRHARRPPERPGSCSGGPR